jgi:hypothetical protein
MATAGAGLALGAAAVALILAQPERIAPAGQVVRVAIPSAGAPVPAAAAIQAAAAAPTAGRARDLECLAEAVYFEARGETGAGQAAVAQVVLNRVRHPAFPKTVCGVVYQGAKSHGCQFSFACDGRTEQAQEGAAWRRARQVAARALAGVVAPQVGAATHFHAAGVQPGWGPSLRRVAQVGLHVFYRFGQPAAVGGAQAAMLTRLATTEQDLVSAENLRLDPADAMPTAEPAKLAVAEAAGTDAGLVDATGAESP